jgi:LmbE family N-acetylglucosaminyl deacetylase
MNVDPIRDFWQGDPFCGEYPRRVVVVSPHLDDAIMSLGATMSQFARGEVEFEVLTVFGGDPTSDAPADAWDSKSGFATEGAAAKARRAEDRRACQLVGADSRCLSFGAENYERHGSKDEIWEAVTDAIGAADCVLLPGHPLVHRDHAEVSHLLLARGLNCRWLALYAEQPYSFYQRQTSLKTSPTPALSSVLSSSLTWKRFVAAPEHRRIKLQAIQAYQSQLRQLGLGYMGRRQMLWHEARQGGEAVAWLQTPSSRWIGTDSRGRRSGERPFSSAFRPGDNTPAPGP